MNKKYFLPGAVGIAGALALQSIPGCQPAQDESRPNIVLIFMDDMGYGDIGNTGALEYNTPNLDNLATEGMRFTNFLAAQAVCSASRAALLTGCYPNRIGIAGALGPKAKNGINSEETTIAEMLKSQGYATGIFGKWHLGHHKKFLPLQHGFDEYLGIPYSNDMWPIDYDGLPIGSNSTTPHKGNHPALPLIDGNEKITEIQTLDDQATLTTRYTERAVSFIKKHKDEPFFLYIPHSMVHVPLGVSEKFKGKSEHGLFGDVMMEIDWSVGQVLQALEDYNLDDNTIVIFTSDNGPWLNYGNHAGSTGGLREGKGTSFEGGQREPCIMRWPGKIPEGEICNQLSSTIDILPTLAEISGASLPENKIDGVNILPLLLGKKDIKPRKNFLYYYWPNNLEAVRIDNWKLVLPHPHRSYIGVLPGNDGWPGPYARDTAELALYNLKRDPGERFDVKKLYPEMVEKLQKLADNAREDLGDKLYNIEGKNVRKSGQIIE
ncbi:sulfatase [Bacteroidota bacterium]